MIVFWIEFPLMHVSSLIRSLSLFTDERVVVVCEKNIPERRLKMGFYAPEFGKAEVYVAPDDSFRQELQNIASHENAFHVFSGLDKYPKNYSAMRHLINKDCFVGVYLEAQNLNIGVKQFFRFLKFKWLVTFRLNKVDFLLALGKRGVEQYSFLGFPVKKIYEFAYFFDSRTSLQVTRKTDIVMQNRVLYVGSLSKNKDVMLLLEAFVIIAQKVKCELTIVGDGPERQNLQLFAAQHQISSMVKFIGYVTHQEILRHFDQSDLLVLPSKADGWGAVVTEALSCGVPVVVSNKCGASTVTTVPGLGVEFIAGNLQSLIDAMLMVLHYPAAANPYRNREEIITKANKYFSDIAGVHYLLAIINSFRNKLTVKVETPWHEPLTD